MNVDWGYIISTILISAFGFLTGGTIMFYKAKKGKAEAETKGSQAEAKGADLTVGDQALATLKSMQIYFHETLGMYVEKLHTKDDIIDKNETVIYEMRSKMKEYDYMFESLERKVNGLQEQYTIEKSKKHYAEGFACVHTDCKLRRPILGTFNEKKEVDEVTSN